MIQNPYPTPENPQDQSVCRFQTYLSAEDKALLTALRPARGTAQAVINHLILNLCHDLRDLGLTFFHPDADDILSVLVERRPITDEQLVRLRRTTFGVSTKVPTWLQQHRRGPEVRKGASSTEASADDTPRRANGGKQPHRKAKSKTSSKGTEAKDVS